MRDGARIVIVILVLCIGAVRVSAQEPVSDSLVVQEPVMDSVIVQVDTITPPAPLPAVKQQDYADTAIFQGVNIRLDILNPLLELMRTGWHTYDVEAAVNVRLKNRFFPTFEFGHAGLFLQEKDAVAPVYNGHGEFARVGLDLNPLKKHPEQRSVLLVGVRVATGWQKLEPSVSVRELQGKWIADAWGEVVAGVQVDIAKGFNMGWAVRMKFLFTEKIHDSLTVPYYIPGYGYRDSMRWGFDYYLGYSF